MPGCCFFFIFLASSVSFEAKDSRPTLSSLARQRPETTKLPESRGAPAFLAISSDSPVTRASFTVTFPLHTTASAHIWLPASNITISSSTSSSLPTQPSLPSRMTFVRGADTSESFSSVFLARISCIVPIMVFTKTTTRNVRLLYEPSTSSMPARMKKIRLKYVKMFVRMIFGMVFVVLPTSMFERPSSVRSSTCAALRPYSGEGKYRLAFF